MMGGVVYIPVQNSEEEVMVALDHLPRDATDMIDILKAEQAPLHLWLIIAREYFKQGKLDQFRQILEEGSSPEIDEYYADVKYERIAILNALAAYYTYLGKIETKQRDKEEHFISATQYYNRASRIDAHEPYTWIGKGQLYVAKGELQTASESFRIALVEDPNCVPALLGQACVDFNIAEREEHYKKAMDSYRSSLEFYKLDPDNVEALVALGVMDLQTNEAHGIKRGMEKMQGAFEIHPYCPMALNCLANHFFFTGQHFLVEQLTETALAVSSHGLMKAHSYYNLARSYHSKAFTELGDLLISSDAGAALDVFKTLEEDGSCIELPWNKVTTLFNYARLLEQVNDTGKASNMYRLILFKITDALKVDDKCPNALSMLGDLELKIDDWVKAKDTFRAAKDATDGKDSYATLALGNWNYFAAIRNEKRGPKLEATHLEKAKELYTKVQEAASGSVFVQMPDVWVNLAHVYFAQGHFALAAKMEQWKHSSNTAGKRRERSQVEDEEGGDRRRRRGGKRRKKEKKMKTRYEEEADMEDEHEDLEEDTNAMNEYEDDGAEKAQNDLIAAGLEDSDAEDDLGGHSTAINRKRRAWSESDEDDEPLGEKVNSAETDEETNGIKAKSVAGDDDEEGKLRTIGPTFFIESSQREMELKQVLNCDFDPS
ncbi:RNA polymerase-associated protein CTR9 [Musa troglodytarum]|uniref:RNA polymerase-associated protein CTR9 n=1 Tax=Musa troglodytarum TaxID=320322 RepID=A0A9E7GRY7_9LILI|nr:RNA polymerase-associated protein CTR9 [Musa troglodytarum]